MISEIQIGDIMEEFVLYLFDLSYVGEVIIEDTVCECVSNGKESGNLHDQFGLVIVHVRSIQIYEIKLFVSDIIYQFVQFNFPTIQVYFQ